MSFEPLKDVVQRVLAQRNNSQVRSFSAAEVCSFANKLIEAELPQVAGRARAQTLQHGVLTIIVTGSAVGSEVQLGSGIILAELQKRFPKVKKLQVRTDYAAFHGG